MRRRQHASGARGRIGSGGRSVISSTSRPPPSTRPAKDRSHAVDAAALQDHFSRELRLSLAPLPPRRPQPNRGRQRGGSVQQVLGLNRRRRRSAVGPTGRGGSQSAPCSRDPSPGRDEPAAAGPSAPERAPNPSVLPATFGGDGGEPDPTHSEAGASWRCPTCTFINHTAVATDRCSTCGSSRPRPGRSRRLTLAQQRGLVPRPPPALTAGQWREKVASAASRLHAREMCPICQDPFADRDQVILSCEHAYHRSCLETFERFSSLRGQAPTCPVCRAKDYQKHLTHVGRETHREVCALQIQSLYRGHVTRKQFHALRVEYYASGGGDVARKRAFFADRMARVSTRISEAVAQREDALDALFAELDRGLAMSRQVFAMIDDGRGGGGGEGSGRASAAAAAAAAPRTGAFDWASVIAKAMQRSPLECPICLMDAGPEKPCTLLSCSHVVHKACLNSFEVFTGEAVKQCPVCRTAYSKRELEREDWK